MTDPTSGARSRAVVGFALGIAAAILGVLWQVAIPLALVALVVSVTALGAARGRDRSTAGFAYGGLAAGVVALGLAAATFVAEDEAGIRAPSTVDGIESSTPDDEHPPQKDLEPGTQCTVDLAGLRADGTIVNRSDRAWRYSLRVVWENDGEQAAESVLLLDAVAPGAQAPFRAVSPKSGTAATTCRVASIDRLSP